jgi:hypothetical protein
MKNKFKIREYVRCIKNYEKKLSVNTLYKIIHIKKHSIVIIDDMNLRKHYRKSRFELEGGMRLGDTLVIRGDNK